MAERTYGVLGAHGFLGSHVVDALRAAGRTVVGASRRDGVDARDLDTLLCWMTSERITHLINAAAECGGIGLNREKPAELWASTTLINAAVLEASRRCRIQKLVMLGTVCSYAHSCPVPFREGDLMHHGLPESTNAAYGVAKLAGLLGTQAYRQQYGLNGIYLLPVNLYGPRDNFDPASSHVIPALIRRFQEAKAKALPEVVVWGTGTATREFLYVEDAARAIVLAADRYDSPEPVNLGFGRETSIQSLVQQIAELTGYKGNLNWDHTKPDGQPRRSLNTDRAKTFGFAATTVLSDGLARTVEWYLNSLTTGAREPQAPTR